MLVVLMGGIADGRAVEIPPEKTHLVVCHPIPWSGDGTDDSAQITVDHYRRRRRLAPDAVFVYEGTS